MSPDKLVHMANQIAAFFETQPHDRAVAGTAEHINKFWEPRMRTQLLEIVAKGGAGLKPLVLAAVPYIRRPQTDVSTTPPNG